MVPLMLGHRLMGTVSDVLRGTLRKAGHTYDQAIALYDPAEHRAAGDSIWPRHQGRSLILSVAGLCGFLAIPRLRAETLNRRSRKRARSAKPATLMYALFHTCLYPYLSAETMRQQAREADELVALADEKGSCFGRSLGMLVQGCVLALTGKASDAVACDHLGDHRMAVNGSNSVRAILLIVLGEALMLNSANSMMLGAALREAMTMVETTKESWCEAEINRMAGEIALMSPEPDAAKARSVFRAGARGCA